MSSKSTELEQGMDAGQWTMFIALAAPWWFVLDQGITQIPTAIFCDVVIFFVACGAYVMTKIAKEQTAPRARVVQDTSDKYRLQHLESMMRFQFLREQGLKDGTWDDAKEGVFRRVFIDKRIDD